MRCLQSTIVVGLGLHACVLEKCKQMPILLTLENMTSSVVACFLEFWDMDVQVMGQMFVSFDECKVYVY
jgi:hypothetical protein